LNGWDAFIALFWSAPFEAFSSGESAALLLLYSPVVNALLLLSPIAVVAAPRHAAAFGAVLFACGIGVVVVACWLDVTWYVGFYVWVASFFLMSLACTLASICCLSHDADQRRELLERRKSPCRGVLGKDY
jgi:hypothetical protein